MLFVVCCLLWVDCCLLLLLIGCYLLFVVCLLFVDCCSLLLLSFAVYCLIDAFAAQFDLCYVFYAAFVVLVVAIVIGYGGVLLSVWTLLALSLLSLMLLWLSLPWSRFL